MTVLCKISSLLLLLSLGLVTQAQASSLRVSPATIELPASSRVASLTLRNSAKQAAHYQIRLFRWVQENGRERLEPTNDVIVSPPITRVEPGLDYIVRIIRLAKRPVIREENYRVIVDELPAQNKRSSRTVSFLVRYSIPVFFSPDQAQASALHWRFSIKGNDWVLSARNPGHRRAKIINLRLRDAEGREFMLAEGLAGYVLAGARRDWRFKASRWPGSGQATLLFRNEQGAVNVPVALPGHP